jgi:hypothetical protein
MAGKFKIAAKKIEVSNYPTDKWDLYRDGITQSMLGTFLQCPEMFKNKYILGMQNEYEQDTHAMDFGTYFHECLDHLYTAFNQAESKSFFYENLGEIISKTVEDYHDWQFEKLTANPGGKDSWLNLTISAGWAEALLPAYFNRYENDFHKLEWVALEEILDILYTLTKKPIRLRGKQDGIVRKSSGLWLFETKTKGRIDEEAISDKLSIDLQVMVYLWMLWKKYDEMPKGVIYNIIRRPQLRRKQNETPQEFVKRCEIDVAERPDFYFLRIEGELYKSDMTKFEKDFYDILTQLEKWYAGEYHYKNVMSCTGMYKPCEFLKFCSGQSGHFNNKREMFSELKMIPFKDRVI